MSDDEPVYDDIPPGIPAPPPDPLWVCQRRAEYPDFKDYIDGLVKGDTAQMQAYIDECLAVKARYPKQDDPA